MKIDDDLTPIINQYLDALGRPSALRRAVTKAIGDKSEPDEPKPAKGGKEPKAAPGKANLAALNAIYQRYMNVFTGKHIALAATAWKAGDYLTAAQEFQTARNGFQRAKNPQEWNALEAWRVAADQKSDGGGGQSAQIGLEA